MNFKILLNRCRLCQAKPGIVNYTKNLKFSIKVFECTKIQLNSDNLDHLPQSICSSCKIRIEKFFVFLQSVRLVDKNLRRHISQQEGNIRTTENDNYACTKSEVVSVINDNNKKLEINRDCADELLINVEKTIDLKNDEIDDVTSAGKADESLSDSDNNSLKHAKLVSTTCTYENCNKVCTSIYSWRTHLMKHEGILPFLCVTCGKAFTTKNSLNCHEKTHLKVKGYVCKECNIGFSVAGNLRTHQKKHHEGVRFYCSQCTRAFITKSSLDRHELVHTGIKEFKCKSCTAAFYTNKELLKHQRYHQGLRLHKCAECYKTFFEKHHLKVHLRVHTGEKPYSCKVIGCEKSFKESQKLGRHMKSQHPPIQ